MEVVIVFCSFYKKRLLNSIYQKNKKENRDKNWGEKKGDWGEKKKEWKEEGGLPPFAKEYDVDEDGELNADELELFRTEMKDKIRSGERFGPSCDKGEKEEEGVTEEGDELTAE